MKIAYVFIPFAYNGPCISESGPKVMHYELEKYYDSKDMFQYELKLNETPIQYLNRIYKNVVYLNSFYDRVIIFGGNHLSLLPIYQIAEDLCYNSITFDAHRDYLKNNGKITHASFLRYVRRGNSKKYILGFRDYINDVDKYKYFSKEISANYLKTKNLDVKIPNEIKFIDIDVDFFDPAIFPYTNCKKDNGFSVNEMFEILKIVSLKDIKILSFSEYVNILDNNKNGIKIMMLV